ncbi:MAG: anhydro-N-acetylmuramic acid kinase [Rhodobacteraceae bacterium]|nr:anhydro-N-acetylmuramic acid kinase [Paracoccaceae bacterium]
MPHLEENWFIGCMSGTSMDGVDIAAIRTDGQKILEFGPTASKSFTPDEIEILHMARGKWPGEKGVNQAVRIVEETHLALLMETSPEAIVGFHGQTLAHDPENRKTYQAGDGQYLAENLGKTVVWDFRQQDMLNGGEGAPLAPFYHFALAKYLGMTEPCAFINIGGITNISFVDPQKGEPVDNGALIAFDIGPGNSLIDKYCNMKRNLPFDRDGYFAFMGKADNDLIRKFLEHEQLGLEGPKSFDIHDFYFLLNQVEQLKFEDGVTTLTECTIKAISTVLERTRFKPKHVVLCGGGTKNSYIVARLKEILSMEIHTAEEWGLDSQYLEAQAFGFLAARVLSNLPTSAPGTTGCEYPTVGGRISQPRKTKT